MVRPLLVLIVSPVSVFSGLFFLYESFLDENEKEEGRPISLNAPLTGECTNFCEQASQLTDRLLVSVDSSFIYLKITKVVLGVRSMVTVDTFSMISI